MPFDWWGDTPQAKAIWDMVERAAAKAPVWLRERIENAHIQDKMEILNLRDFQERVSRNEAHRKG